MLPCLTRRLLYDYEKCTRTLGSYKGLKKLQWLGGDVEVTVVLLDELGLAVWGQGQAVNVKKVFSGSNASSNSSGI